MTSLLLFKPTDDQLRKAIDFIFKLYDKDRNKVLDYEQVKNVSNAKEITEQDIRKFVGVVDADGDGRISKQQLLIIFKKILESYFK